MSWAEAFQRASENAIPRTGMVLEAYRYVVSWARELRKVKEEVIRDLDRYVEEAMSSLRAVGAKPYLARGAEEAREIVGDIVGKGKLVVMSKSMTAAEVGLRQHLEGLGNEVWETDLGELLIQLAGDQPSHIIAPALHMTREDVARLLRERLGADVPDDADHATLASVAARFLRDKFLRADVGITGANALAADSGALVVVENEGNARLTMTLPRVHIAIVGMEKIVPTFQHAVMQAAVQAAYAGLFPPTYMSITAGPSSTSDIERKRVSPAQGPGELHVVLLDNGRSRAARDKELWEALLCVRCGRCAFHCPTYMAAGPRFGAAPYAGPVGVMWAAVTRGVEGAGNASLLCLHSGGCREVCPMDIDIPRIIQRVKSRYVGRLLRTG